MQCVSKDICFYTDIPKFQIASHWVILPAFFAEKKCWLSDTTSRSQNDEVVGEMRLI